MRLADKLLKQKILVKYSEGQPQKTDVRCSKNKASGRREEVQTLMRSDCCPCEAVGSAKRELGCGAGQLPRCSLAAEREMYLNQSYRAGAY